MRTLKYYKTRVWMIITILLIQIALPTLNVMIGNAFTVKSSTDQGWDISKTEEDNVKAVLDTEGILTISGTGKMKDWATSGEVPWNKENKTVKKVVIKEGVTTIGERAFCYTSDITSVELPKGITKIGVGAFYNCNKLKSIELPKELLKIERKVFAYCTSLTQVMMQEGLTEIEDEAFYKCENLTKVIIPENVTNIGNFSFAYCTNMVEIEFPEGLKHIGERAFYQCSNLAKMELPEGITNIEACAFTDCNSLKTIKIPNGITKISDSLFYNCTSLSSVEISDEVTSIGSRAFYNCSRLKDIEIPEGIKDIGLAAFHGCTNLKSVTIPEGVTRIEGWLFGHCNNIEKVVIPTKVKEIAEYAFYECNNLTIYCKSNSYAEIYAKENNIEYKIDDNKPVIEKVTGNPTELTNKDVKLKIIAKDNGVGLAVKPYSFDDGKTWQKEDTKTYTKNTNNIVIKVKDALGNIATYETINITKIKELKIEISEDTKTINNKSYIQNLKINTSISKLLDSITTNGEVKVYEGETEITDKTKKIATGMKIKITLNEESKSYLLVVTGDVNGDAKADLNDILAVNRHRLNKVVLDGENLLAGDVNEDDKVDLNDILQINRFRLGKLQSL